MQLHGIITVCSSAWAVPGPECGCWLCAVSSPSPGHWDVLGHRSSLLMEPGLRPAHLWERFLPLKPASIKEQNHGRLPWLDTRSPSDIYLSSLLYLIACLSSSPEVFLHSVFVDSTISLLSEAYSETSYAFCQHSCSQNFLLLSYG